MIEDRMANRKLTEKQLADLTAAHARLFSAWQVLTETPNPGSRRVKPSKPERDLTTHAISEPEPIGWPEPVRSPNASEPSLASGLLA